MPYFGENDDDYDYSDFDVFSVCWDCAAFIVWVTFLGCEGCDEISTCTGSFD
jgi:hypothetical protein